MNDSTTVHLPSEAIAALEQGSKIEAIKIVRVTKGLGLKESKDLVEEYLRTDPGLEQRFKAKQSENSSVGKFIFFLIVIGIILYMVLSGKLF